MFHWLKKRLLAWVEDRQRRAIARLQQETTRLKAEIEQSTGKPLQLTPEDRRLLAEKAKGIDLETLKQISVIDPADFISSEPEIDSTENRYLGRPQLQSATVFMFDRVSSPRGMKCRPRSFQKGWLFAAPQESKPATTPFFEADLAPRQTCAGLLYSAPSRPVNRRWVRLSYRVIS